jgi:hypothetical protein
MRTNVAAHQWWLSVAWSAFRFAGLSTFGFIVWFWLFSAEGPVWRAVSLVAVQALAALAGVAWYLPRARAERRWRAALDHYAEQQQANRAFRSVIEHDGRRHAAAPPLAAGGGAAPR